MPTKAELELQLKAAQAAAKKAATPTKESSQPAASFEATVISRAVNRSGNLILTLEYFQGEEAAEIQVSLTPEQLAMYQLLGTSVPKSGAAVKAKPTANAEWAELMID